MKLSKNRFVSLFVILCGVWVGCSDDHRNAGGVTDIGNSIAGTVTLADGVTPAVAARVVAYADSWESAGILDSIETATDSLGRFTLDDVPREMQVLYVSKDAENYLARAVKDSVDYILGNSKSLTGSIAEQTMGKVRIVGTSLEAFLDSNGNFAFDAVPYGELSLVYVKDGASLAHYEFATSESDSAEMLLPPLAVSENGDSVLVIAEVPEGTAPDPADSLTVISVELSGAPMETLYGFVLPVKFNDKIDFEKFSDPAAFQVLSEDGAELNFEVDYWTPSASQGVLWVRLDSLPAGTQRVDLSLALREKPLAPQGAFLEADSVMASLHMNGDATIHAATDSDAAYGIIGYGATLSAGQYISLDSMNPCSGDFTLSVWALWNGDNGNHQILFAKRASWADSTLFQWYFEANSGVFAVYDVLHWDSLPGVSLTADSTQWKMLSLVSKNDSVSMFVNGKRVSEPIAFQPRELDMALPFRVGGNDVEDETWNGSLDEVRVVSKARSAEWLRLEYETQYAAKNLPD